MKSAICTSHWHLCRGSEVSTPIPWSATQQDCTLQKLLQPSATLSDNLTLPLGCAAYIILFLIVSLKSSYHSFQFSSNFAWSLADATGIPPIVPLSSTLPMHISVEAAVADHHGSLTLSPNMKLSL